MRRASRIPELLQEALSDKLQKAIFRILESCIVRKERDHNSESPSRPVGESDLDRGIRKGSPPIRCPPVMQTLGRHDAARLPQSIDFGFQAADELGRRADEQAMICEAYDGHSPRKAKIFEPYSAAVVRACSREATASEIRFRRNWRVLLIVFYCHQFLVPCFLRENMRKVLVALSVSLPLAAVTGACTQVPGLDVETESVRIIDVVKRVKCDIYDAFTEDTARGRRLISDQEGYKWLESWTAQVDLNLLVNNQAGLTPGATIIDPLHQVSIPRVGTFSQSFTMGLGGGVNTTAARTETITFSLSVKEIEAELRNPSHKSWAYQNCQFENGPGLRSDLKLREWVASSLAPADARRPYLTVGHHKSPRASSSSGTRKAGSKVQGGAGALSVRMLSLSAQEDRKQVSDALRAVADVMSKIRALKQGSPGDKLNKEINQTIEIARAALQSIKNDPSQKGIREHLRVAEITLTWIVRFSTLSKRQDLPQSQIARLIGQLETDIDEISTFATTREIEEALKTLQEGKSELELVLANLDPPIDSISHQVQFVLALNANASPGWTLVRFRGPSPNNGLVSGSHSNTHTLTIVMGASPGDVSSKLNALQIGTNIGNALNSTTIRVAPVQ